MRTFRNTQKLELMKNITLLMACLGLGIGCAPNYPNDAELLKMPTIEKWAYLEEGMSTDQVFRIVGAPQSSRVSQVYTVYTFDCFLCTATFDTLKQLDTWHAPKSK
ncbi:MAG: hypothetical protein ACI976_000749 [Aureispira sp.]